MKIIKYFFTMIVIIMLGVNICACGINEDATFNGSRASDEEHFDIDFEILNGTYTHDLVMNEGDSIALTIEKESGSISLLIQKESKDAIYRGDDVEAGTFEVVISEAGTYTLSVTGKKAKGHVVFTRIENSTAVSTDQIVGPWHLDDSATDMDAIYDAFPGAMEFGNAMEIRSDGRISWHIGADGGVGTYELKGNSIDAIFTGDLDGTSYENKMEIRENTEGCFLVMKYKDYSLTWKYGEGETGKGY